MDTTKVAQYGITVNRVAPGLAQTGWTGEDLEKAVLPLMTMGKLIQPVDMLCNYIVKKRR